MRFVAIERSVTRFATLTLGVLFACVMLFETTQAVDTQVRSNVCQSGSYATLAITSPPQNTTTGESSVTIGGEVSLVGQFVVFVDGLYVDTVPLPNGATTFSHAVLLAPGQHTVRFEGQDICQTSTPVAELVITHNPAQAATPATGQSQGSSTSMQSTSAIESVAGYVNTDGELESSRGFMAVIDKAFDVMYQGLVALDFVQPGSTDTLPRMLARFFGLLIGLILLLFTKPVLRLAGAVYRAMRGGRQAGLAGFGSKHLRIWVRLIGVGLIVAVFLFLG